MVGIAEKLGKDLKRMRLGKGRHEVQLWLRDGSYLHFRHDRHTRWVQAGGGEEGGLAKSFCEQIENFELRGRLLYVWFIDQSRIRVWQGVFGRLKQRLGSRKSYE